MRQIITSKKFYILASVIVLVAIGFVLRLEPEREPFAKVTPRLGSGVVAVFAAGEPPSFVVEPEVAALGTEILAEAFEITGPKDVKIDSSDFEFKLVDQGEIASLQFNPKKNTFRPGRYHVEARFETSKGIRDYSQDFYWGVLAMNFNKSVYLPREKAYIQMAVLDDLGNTICDAELTLKIQDARNSLLQKLWRAGQEQTLSTRDGTIIQNSKCGPNNVIDTPDYYTYYDLKKPGIYQLELAAETPNGTRTMKDLIEVRASLPFEIERLGPTRIFPKADYTMKAMVRANQDFQGVVREYLPASFETLYPKSEIQNKSQINNSNLQDNEIIQQWINNNIKILEWQVDWRAGETYELAYSFDAPDISPEFYLLGPLKLYPSSSAIQASETVRLDLRPSFEEARRWQIASDATNWGDDTQQGSTFSVNWVRCMGGTSPNIAGMTVESISVSSAGSGDARLAVYQGGTLSDPQAATLVWDAGTVAAGSGFVTISGGTDSLAANEVTWICTKGNDSTFTTHANTSWDSSSDFQSARGRWEASGLNTDETVAYPSSLSGGGTSFSDFWYSWYLSYNFDAAPDTPTIEEIPAFSNMAASSTQPAIGGFASRDSDDSSLEWVFTIDDDINFGSPATTTFSVNYPGDAGWGAATFADTATTSYTIQSGDALTDGTTYWWTVYARDITTTSQVSASSTAMSLTASSTLTVDRWHQTTGWQFNTNIIDSDIATTTTSFQLTGKVASSTVFSTSGSDTWVVPAGVTTATIKAWGAGGGGGEDGGATAGAGGGGGFAQADITTTPAESLLTRVGAGGAAGGVGSQAAGAGGGGGGLTGVFRTSVTQGNALVIGGSGGGGGGGDNLSSGNGAAAGAGGGTNGANGSNAGTGGGGQGGQGATGGSAGSGAGSPTDGSALTGGDGGAGQGTAGSGGGTGGADNGGDGGNDGSTSGGGGGGGAGYAGAGGGGTNTGTGNSGGGGGGGSGRVTGTNTTLTAGSGTAVANSGDSDYGGGAGVGGASGAAGATGRIVINFTIPTSTSATATSTEIDFDWVGSVSSWGEVIWGTTEPASTNVLFKLGYDPDKTVGTEDCDTLIPDGDLSGNTAGFDASSSPLDISGLSTSTYNRICLVGVLSTSGDFVPSLDEWTVTWEPPISNSAPTITSVTDSPDPVDQGSVITFSTDWNDADAGENIKVKLCKTGFFVNQNCTDGFWATSTAFTTSDPEAPTYTTTGSDSGTYNYHAFVCDDDAACSAGTQGSFAVNPPAGTSGIRLRSGTFKINMENLKELLISYVTPTLPKALNLKKYMILFLV